MNTIFRDGDNLYKNTRETSKTYFYKMILPTQKRVGNKALLFFFQPSVIVSESNCFSSKTDINV